MRQAGGRIESRLSAMEREGGLWSNKEGRRVKKKQGPVIAPVFRSTIANLRSDYFFFLLSNSMSSSVRSFGVMESTANSTAFSSTNSVYPLAFAYSTAAFLMET